MPGLRKSRRVASLANDDSPVAKKSRSNTSSSPVSKILKTGPDTPELNRGIQKNGVLNSTKPTFQNGSHSENSHNNRSQSPELLTSRLVKVEADTAPEGSTLSSTNGYINGDGNGVSELSNGEEALLMPSSATNLLSDSAGGVLPNGENNSISEVITGEILEEERKLSELGAQEEEENREKMTKEWDTMQDEAKEARYKKLQALLEKSNLYTSYLVQRMKELKADTNHSSTEQDQSLNMLELFTGGELREYQKEGLIWLNTLYENGINGILGDEMGLGKTIQCIAALGHIITMNVGGPYLVVAPLSTLPNWHSEFKRFAPEIPTVLYHGTKDARADLRKDMRKVHTVKNWRTRPVVLTSYEIAMRDRGALGGLKWKYLIVDEGHRIKNSQCRLIKELRMYNSTHRLLLTGTPLQNDLGELWSLLNFLLPEIFDDLDSFQSWFQLDRLTKVSSDQVVAEEKQSNILAMLHQILSPFLLRRLKVDVCVDLPPKRELLVYAPLSELQKSLYTSIASKSQELLKQGTDMGTGELKAEEEALIGEEGRSRRNKKRVDYTLLVSNDNSKDGDIDIDEWMSKMNEVEQEKQQRKESEKENRAAASRSSKGTAISLMNIVMQLRKVCNHPYLINHPETEDGELQVDENLVSSSGKFMILDQILTELKVQGRKVLVFSQMTRVLDLLQDFMYLRDYNYCRLDGSTCLDDRQEQMKEFNSPDGDKFVFLLSTRAGGLGINLASADTVIIFDSDWNPQSDLQAQDRCHRIGQTQPVLVLRLVCAKTVDEKILERANLKRRLEKMVIHKEKFKSGLSKNFQAKVSPINPMELLELLQSTDYQGILATASDSVPSSQSSQKRKGGKKKKARRVTLIPPEDLDALLDRSARMFVKDEPEDRNVEGTQESRSSQPQNHNSCFKIMAEEQ